MFSLNLGSLVVHLTANDVMFKKIMARTEGTLKRTGDKLTSLGKKLSVSVTAPLTAVAGLGLKAFADFDDAMTQSLAIVGDVSDETRKKMEALTKEISGRSITSSTDLAKSYYYLASAGLNVEQSMATLPVVERFAVAGMFDMARATELLMDAQAALGLKVLDAGQNMTNAARLSDVLIRANVLANATTQQFAQALTNKAAAALRLLNKDLEEGVAVLATFADQGIKDVEAGEKLNIVLRDLQKSAMSQPAAWKKLGMAVYDVNGKMLPMADIIEQLEKTFLPMSDQQKKATMTMLDFQDRSWSATQSLLGASQKIRDYEKALRAAGGYTEQVANRQLASLSSQMKMLWNNVKGAAAEIGRILAPMVIWLGDKIKDLMKWWKGLTDSTKRFIVIAGIVAAALGPVLVLMGQMTIGLSFIARAFTMVSLSSMIWVGVIGLVVVALAFLTDAMLQLFDAGNLGIIDLVNSFRIGGYKIGTWMQAMWLQVFKSWEWTKWRILQGWESIKWAAQEVGGYIWRFMLRVGKGISDAFWFMYKKIQEGMNWISNRGLDLQFALHIIDEDEYVKGIQALDGLQRKTNEFADSVSQVYQKEIDESLTSAEKRYMDYYKTMDGLEKEYTDQMKGYDQTMARIFAEDENERRKLEEAAKPAAAAAVATGAGKPTEGGVEASGPTWSKNAFQQVSLSRFSLASPTGVKEAAEKTQVAAPELEAKADEQINILKRIANDLTMK